jgi:hypothetical protein
MLEELDGITAEAILSQSPADGWPFRRPFHLPDRCRPAPGGVAVAQNGARLPDKPRQAGKGFAKQTLLRWEPLVRALV